MQRHFSRHVKKVARIQNVGLSRSKTSVANRNFHKKFDINHHATIANQQKQMSVKQNKAKVEIDSFRVSAYSLMKNTTTWGISKYILFDQGYFITYALNGFPLSLLLGQYVKYSFVLFPTNITCAILPLMTYFIAYRVAKNVPFDKQNILMRILIPFQRDISKVCNKIGGFGIWLMVAWFGYLKISYYFYNKDDLGKEVFESQRCKINDELATRVMMARKEMMELQLQRQKENVEVYANLNAIASDSCSYSYDEIIATKEGQLALIDFANQLAAEIFVSLTNRLTDKLGLACKVKQK